MVLITQMRLYLQYVDLKARLNDRRSYFYADITRTASNEGYMTVGRHHPATASESPALAFFTISS